MCKLTSGRSRGRLGRKGLCRRCRWRGSCCWHWRVRHMRSSRAHIELVTTRSAWVPLRGRNGGGERRTEQMRMKRAHTFSCLYSGSHCNSFGSSQAHQVKIGIAAAPMNGSRVARDTQKSVKTTVRVIRPTFGIISLTKQAPNRQSGRPTYVWRASQAV